MEPDDVKRHPGAIMTRRFPAGPSARSNPDAASSHPPAVTLVRARFKLGGRMLDEGIP
jgi:hypothetical protein